MQACRTHMNRHTDGGAHTGTLARGDATCRSTSELAAARPFPLRLSVAMYDMGAPLLWGPVRMPHMAHPPSMVLNAASLSLSQHCFPDASYSQTKNNFFFERSSNRHFLHQRSLERKGNNLVFFTIGLWDKDAKHQQL